MDIQYFQIADFLFRLRLFDTERLYVKVKLKREIEYYLHGFILKKPTKRIDFTIDIVWDDVEECIVNNTTSVYIHFFVRNANTQITSFYRISLFEFQSILLNVLVELLLKNGGVILHASSVLRSGYADVFVGKSGSGKSTITSLLKKKYEILADDVVIIRKINRCVYLFQTPFLQKNLSIKKDKKKYMLGNIFSLIKSPKLTIEKVKNENKAQEIINHSVMRNGLKKLYLQQIKVVLKTFNMIFFLSFPKNNSVLHWYSHISTQGVQPVSPPVQSRSLQVHA
jgi:hypothetical protein